MKVLLLTAVMEGGGTERVIAVLANYMAARKHDVTILMTAGEKVVYELNPAVNVISLGGRTGGSIGKRLDRIRAIRRYYKKDAKRLIVSFGTETNLFALIAGIGLKNKILVSERNDPNRCNYQGLRNAIYTLADGFVFQTKEAMECFERRMTARGEVIPNPVKEGLPTSFKGERKKQIVAVGRLEPQKNHKLLIQAFSDFYKKHPDYSLVIYGKGELEEELKVLSEEKDVSNAVVFAGFATDVIDKIRDSAMYVLSSDYEGISNSLMEAMAIGMPVISTKCPIGGSELLIRDGVNGLLVSVGDKAALSDAMCRIAEDEAVAVKMADEAEKVREDYSSEKICGKWLLFMSKYCE